MARIPTAYTGREQALLKHTILREYLTRLFMIIGRHQAVINYVDCFAGPWQETDEHLSDTSIGVSLEQMASCKQSLQEKFNRNVTFRALYIEQSQDSYQKLHQHLDKQPHSSIETHCLNGDYADLQDQILQWCGPHFTFFFIDPTGWRNVISSNTMEPLLQRDKSEFLINLMYDFVNRAVNIDRHASDMEKIYGRVPDLETATPEERKTTQLRLYRQQLNSIYRGRTTYVPIEKPGTERTLYFLIYLTRNNKGLIVFKQSAERLELKKPDIYREIKIRIRTEQSGTGDLFADDFNGQSVADCNTDATDSAAEYLLSRLSEKPLLIDDDQWADMLEHTDFYPSELQQGMRKLTKEGRVTNLDADVQRRRTQIVQPDYPNKSERWVIVSLPE